MEVACNGDKDQDEDEESVSLCVTHRDSTSYMKRKKCTGTKINPMKVDYKQGK